VRTEVREEKGKGKEVVRESGTGANTVPVASRTILKQPDPTRWELMEITRRWKAGNLTEEEMEVASAATARLSDNQKGESGKGGTIVKAALETLQAWWVAGRTRRTELLPPAEVTQTPRTPTGLPAGAPRAPTAPRTVAVPTAPLQSTALRMAAVPRAPLELTWAQRAAVAAALPEVGMQRVGKKGKPVKELSGLEPIRARSHRTSGGSYSRELRGHPRSMGW
jgi:hypothetical protein